MQNVDIITSEMHQVHGANRVTEKLISGRSAFENRGYYLRNLISQDGIMKCQEYTSSVLGLRDGKSDFQKRRSRIAPLKQLPVYKSYIVQKTIMNKSIKENTKVLDLIDELDNQSDLVIFQDPFTAFVVLREKREQIKRSILISHAAEDPLEQLFINRPSLKGTEEERYLRKIFKYVFNNVSKVVTICRSSQDYMKRTYDLDCPCIINGIEDVKNTGISRLSEGDQKVHIAIVASVQYRKGQDIAVEALSRIERKDQGRIVIHIIGDGNGMADIRNLVANLHLENNVVLHGLCLEVSKMLDQMDAFMLPSRADTVPVAIIEALRAGLPTFATNVGEVPLMIEGCGVVFEPQVEDVLGIYKTILDDGYNFEEMGKSARQKYLSDFNLDTMIRRYSDVLDAI